MCDLTKKYLLYQLTSQSVATIFVEGVVLSFGICAVSIIEPDSKFCGFFEEAIRALKITFWPLAQDNHKVISVDKYHFLLTKFKLLLVKIYVPTFLP